VWREKQKPKNCRSGPASVKCHDKKKNCCVQKKCPLVAKNALPGTRAGAGFVSTVNIVYTNSQNMYCTFATM